MRQFPDANIGWPLVPIASVSVSELLSKSIHMNNAPKLFQKVCCSRGATLSQHVPGPFDIKSMSFGTGLASLNQPIEFANPSCKVDCFSLRLN